MRAKALAVLSLVAVLCSLAALPAQSAVNCFHQAPTITAVPGVATHGTAGDDVILGTSGDDVIYGHGGRDRICGLGGHDELYGGAGRDRISGGDGNDKIVAGGGRRQVLMGGSGNDAIRSEGEESRAYGGPGADVITGKAYGLFQEVYGGSGNDRLFARTGSMNVYGGTGNDVLRSYAAFVDLNGEAGDDRIFSSYRNGLDAGAGFDRCSLDLTVPDTGCERITLLCGTGGDHLPLLMHDLTTAAGDFDGDKGDDTLYVWKSGSQWRAHIQTAAGYGAQIVLPTSEYVGARAIGGHDVNGDGLDEAFVRVDAGASSDVVGIYTLWEAVGSPTTGFSCALRPVWFAGTSADAAFVIDGGIFVQTGAQCRSNDTMREYYQETADGTSYDQTRHDYAYLPHFGSGDPVLSPIGTSTVTLFPPAAGISLAGRFTCGSLSLYP